MDQLHRMSRLRLLSICCVIAGLGLAACTGSDDPAVPEDFVATTTDLFTIHHPPDWEVLAQEPTQVRIAAPGAEEVRPAAAVTVDDVYAAGVEGFDDAVEGTLTVLRGVREDLEEGELEDVDVAGADTARLVSATYTTGVGTRVDHVDLFALSETGQLVHARAESPTGTIDTDVLRSIVTSLSIT